ncbi:hypothetical protein BC943DRAFT_321383 [Umbelopsis sp. AD052]|nr:hypothetical protein BC943DRAFT_321383 [Umbelopsis sp. AD052]
MKVYQSTHTHPLLWLIVIPPLSHLWQVSDIIEKRSQVYQTISKPVPWRALTSQRKLLKLKSVSSRDQKVRSISLDVRGKSAFGHSYQLKRHKSTNDFARK